jgi:hypothetical protein
MCLYLQLYRPTFRLVLKNFLMNVNFSLALNVFPFNIQTFGGLASANGPALEVSACICWALCRADSQASGSSQTAWVFRCRANGRPAVIVSPCREMGLWNIPVVRPTGPTNQSGEKNEHH